MNLFLAGPNFLMSLIMHHDSGLKVCVRACRQFLLFFFGSLSCLARLGALHDVVNIVRFSGLDSQAHNGQVHTITTWDLILDAQL
jgi:hypothetical protein